MQRCPSSERQTQLGVAAEARLTLTYNELRAFEYSEFIHCIELRFYVL